MLLGRQENAEKSISNLIDNLCSSKCRQMLHSFLLLDRINGQRETCQLHHQKEEEDRAQELHVPQ